MLVANSFDLWQKDTFFSAAEEVQQSADIMESAYRTWLKARREGLIPQHLGELSRELRMALGTAKWQLEEFERAVRLSYRSKGDDITITRHSQFLSAIEDQISRVETALKESLDVEGKKPFRWVNLDQEECDDLALFLSGTSGRIKDECNQNNTEGECSFGSEISSQMQITTNQGTSSEEVLTRNEDINNTESGDKISYQDQSTSNCRALEIVVDSDDRQKNDATEITPKEKGFKPFFWRLRGENRLGVRGVLSRTQMLMINWINQQLRGGHRSQRQQQCPLCSTRLKLCQNPFVVRSERGCGVRVSDGILSVERALLRSSVDTYCRVE